MRFGFCASIDDAALMAEAGFDYVEPRLVQMLSIDRVPSLPLPTETFNVFLPGDLKVVGPEGDRLRLRHYLENAFGLLKQVGAKTVVFGSAGSRCIPEGYSPDAARVDIERFLRECSPLAEEAGVTVAIEPLGSKECNILTSVAEAMTYVDALNLPSIRVLADIFHIDSDGQSYEETRAAGDKLVHVHVAGRENRRVPTDDDVDYLARFFGVLKSIGYDARITVEARAVDLAVEAPVALRVLRRAWDLA